jgi:hypothetical protein
MQSILNEAIDLRSLKSVQIQAQLKDACVGHYWRILQLRAARRNSQVPGF